MSNAVSDLEALSHLTLFEGLPEDKAQRLANIAVRKAYTKGELIFETGTPANGLYAVIKGKVKLFRTSPSGKEQIIHVLGPGETFAEVPVFEGTEFPVDCQTLMKSELLFLPREQLKNVIKQDPDMAMNMMALLSARLRQLVNKIDDLSLKEAPSRVASYLLLLRASQKSEHLELDLPKGQIAFYLGTIQETLSRILKRFQEDELISMQGKTIKLLDPDGLQEIADEGR